MAESDNTIKKLLAAVDGQKTHIMAAIGLVAVTYSHFSGVKIPGVSFDDAQWLTTDWQLLGVMCGRDALAKVQRALGSETIIQGVAALLAEKLKPADDAKRQAPQG